MSSANKMIHENVKQRLIVLYMTLNNIFTESPVTPGNSKTFPIFEITYYLSKVSHVDLVAPLPKKIDTVCTVVTVFGSLCLKHSI